MRRHLEIIDTPLDGLKVLQRFSIGDSRGYLERLYCTAELQKLLCGKSIVQINHSHTLRRGSVRGLHYQRSPDAEIKVVSCINGAVFDVAVDLRRGSPTFLRWHGEVLTPGNHRSLFIPEGFAHGFQSLTDDAEMLYFHSHEYVPSSEWGVNVMESKLNIQWVEAITDISTRDSNMPFLEADFTGLTL